MPVVDVTTPTVPHDIAQAVLLPASYGDLYGTVLPALKWLRENAPVALAEIEGYDPVWIVSSHAANQTVLRDANLFHNADVNIMLQPKAGDDYLIGLLGSTKVMRNLSYMEPPEHGMFRDTTSHSFLPGQIRGYEPRFRELAKNAVDRMIQGNNGECDIVRELTAGFPLEAVMDMLGVPTSDFDLMMKLTQDTFGGDDPDWRRDDVVASPEAMAKQWLESTEAFYKYFVEIKNDRMANPRDDLSTAIVTAKLPNGEYMPEEIQVPLVMSIALAGHDTVNSSLAGGLHGLATHPEQLALVKANPKLLPGLVEESLRWATPAKHFMRNATEDTILDGIAIKAGDRLMCSFASANMDESVFENAQSFDITRRPNPHMTFSYGPHVCLGQHIARLEMRILFEEFLSRIETLELAGDPKLKVSNFVSGFKSLPVRYTLA
jgi:cytochrome P450